MTTSPPPQPPAGWYPDPTGKPGEMYWDGEAWHSLTPDIPATPNTEIPATPAAATPPPPPLGHHPGRQLAWPLIALGIILLVVGFLFIPILFTIGLIVLIVGLVLMAMGRRGNATSKPAQPAVSTNGPSGQRKVVFAIAIVLVVLVGVAVNRIGIPFWEHSIYPRFFEKGSSSPSSGSPGNAGGGDGADTSSHSYQEGVKDASAELVVSDIQGGMSNTDACQAAFDMYQGAFSIDNHDQFMAGCADGLKQHPVPRYTPGFQPNP